MEKTNTFINGVPIDQELVHKHKKENVLICNLRRSLSFFLDEQQLEQKIFPHCNDTEKKILLESYIKPDNKLPDNKYTLNGLNYVFSSDDIKDILLKGNLSREDFRFFLDFYKKNKKTSHYKLHKIPHENEISRLHRLVSPDVKKISDRKKTEISDIFHRINHVENPELYYANMIVDTTHPYFFEHPNEHVPGMMVIEAVRQLLVAISHKYWNVPVKNYNFILATMNGVFKSYLELNYPILFKVVQDNIYTFDNGILSDSDFKVHVYQQDQEAAVISIQGNIISSRVFKRLRNSKEPVKTRQWFILKKQIEYKSVIRTHGLKKLETEIEYISHDECIFFVTKESGGFNAEIEDIIEYFMYFSKIGFVHGTAKVLSVNDFGNFSQIHIKYLDMDSADKNNLHEAIKKYGYLLEN